MRPYYFDIDQARTRRAVAIIAFERRMNGGWPPQHARSGHLWGEALTLVRCWYKRVRQRGELARLDARSLRDIGITAAEAQHEYGKPFWRG
jgi:uncharacterized protein YjiS (DUF1127 family)